MIRLEPFGQIMWAWRLCFQVCNPNKYYFRVGFGRSLWGISHTLL